MNFLHPQAFWALGAVALLIFLSLWRQRPRQVIVPSVRIWKLLPDRVPPVRALRRPRLTALLVLQTLAISALVSALAAPGMTERAPGPRRLAVVVDLSAPMIPRMAAVRDELRRLDPSDHMVLYESPDVRRHEGLDAVDRLRPVENFGDSRTALDLAAGEAPLVIWIGDRRPRWEPPAGIRLVQVLVGGPLQNAGIVDANLDSGRLFLRITEPRPVELTVDGERRRLAEAAVHLVEIPDGASRIEASIPPDAFSADDRIVLDRQAGTVEVALEGRVDVAVLRALEAHPRVRIVRGGAPRLIVRVGAEPAEPDAYRVVFLDPSGGVLRWFVPERIAVAEDALTRGIKAEDLVWQEAGELDGPLERPLFFAGGVPVGGVRADGRAVVLAARYGPEGWPARPSFPIFWANVVEEAGGGWVARGLLSEEASRPGTERQPLDPAMLGPRPLVEHRRDLTPAAAALAAILIAACWLAERLLE